MLDKIAEASLLYDFYGQLLTEKQRQVMELYHEENLSLSEIAAEFSISRQGVYDALKNAEKSLAEYENKLGLVEKFGKTSEAIARIDCSIDEITELNKDNKELIIKLNEIKTVINKLEEIEEVDDGI